MFLFLAHPVKAPQYLKYQCSLNMLNGALQLVNQAYGLDAATTAAASGSTSGMLEFTVSEESLLATIQQAAAKATGGAKTVRILFPLLLLKTLCRRLGL